MKQRTLIILHGWGISGSHFSPLVHVLEKKGYKVFAPDMPGFGKNTTMDRPYTLTDYVDFLATFIQTHAIEQPILIGHSFGGRVSIKYANMYKKNVRAIILSGTPGFSPVSSIKKIVFNAIAKIGTLFFQIPGLRPLRKQAQRYLYLLAGAKDFYRAEGYLNETFKRVVFEDLSQLMKHIQTPTLLVWGSDDSLVPVGVANRMNRAIPGSQLLVIEGDHCVSYRKPHEFVTALEPFLRYV